MANFLTSLHCFESETVCCWCCECSAFSVQWSWESHCCIPQDALWEADDDAFITRWTEETYSVSFSVVTLSEHLLFSSLISAVTFLCSAMIMRISIIVGIFWVWSPSILQITLYMQLLTTNCIIYYKLQGGPKNGPFLKCMTPVYYEVGRRSIY